MRCASVVLLILVVILAIEAVPPKKKKRVVRLPFRQVIRKTPRLRRSIWSGNKTSDLDRRASVAIALSNFQDIAWLGAVAVGNPPQSFEVLYDTGSGDSWFPDSTCGENCEGLTKYNGEESESFHDLQQEFFVRYQDNDVAKGIWTADDFVFGDPDDEGDTITVTQQIFGRCTEVPKESLEEESSGLVGLGFPYRSSSRVFPTLIDNMFNTEGLLDDDVISCRFIKGDDQSLDAGEIVLGAVETQYVDGDIQYTSIIMRNGNSPDWAIPIADIQLAGQFLGQSGDGYIDTGSSYITVTDAAAQILWSQIQGAQMTAKGWAMVPPFPSDVSFVIGQRTFTVPAADLLTEIDAGNGMMVGAIQGGAEGGLWIIGNTFIKNHYLVFDFGLLVIGIGKRNDYN